MDLLRGVAVVPRPGGGLPRDTAEALAALAPSSPVRPTIFVVTSDLTLADRPFVFGATDVAARVGVVSRARLGGSETRLRSVLLHEAGHLAGLEDCSDPACLMRPAASAEEIDRRPTDLCPRCAARLPVGGARGGGRGARAAGIVLCLLVAAGAWPLLHARLSLAGAIVGPEGRDDLACLSCHGGDPAHVAPADRSCLSCHITDFDRHLLAAERTFRPERVPPDAYVLAGTHALFTLSFLGLVLRPWSFARLLLAGGAGLLFGGAVAAAFGGEASRWPVEGVWVDSALAPSPDGRWAVVSVRRRDTDGDGRIGPRDLKSVLLLEDGREVRALAEGALAYRDRPVRWSPDGRRVALALPPAGAGWTIYDPADVVVIDPASGGETARWPDGLNPAWIDDSTVAFQRGGRIVVAPLGGGSTVEVDAPAVLDRTGFVLRVFEVDRRARRVIAAYVGRPDPAAAKESRLVEVVFEDGAWRARALPWRGFVPRPTADGLYYYAFSVDRSGNGRYEVALDGADLMLEGETVAEDAAIHGLFDLGPAGGGMRAAFLRRGGRFDLVEVAGAAVGRTLAAGLAPVPATGLTAGGGRAYLTASFEGGAASLFRREGDSWVAVAGPGVARAVATGRGVAVLSNSGTRGAHLGEIRE